jgi:hypothetical protein
MASALSTLETGSSKEAYASGVSWAAVIAGAFVGAALSLSLLALGTGLGLSAVSPWSNVGASSSMVGKAAIVWLITMEIISSAMGGYLAGRLRTKWASVHTDEVYFRDTAHGFLVWAVGLVVTASFLLSAASSMVGGAGQQRGEPAVSMPSHAGTSGVQNSNGNSDSSDYYVDSLFRSERGAEGNGVAVRAEAGHILAHALRHGDLPPTDTTYLAQLVAARTGLNPTQAEKRISEVVAEARQSADSARRAAEHLSLWTFLALLIGAFCASYAATIGGRQRDHVKPI